tara:strand:+ start:1204 stop:1485 length:282 start_codon:yes stop_codon:yes gene_type:complete
MNPTKVANKIEKKESCCIKFTQFTNDQQPINDTEIVVQIIFYTRQQTTQQKHTKQHTTQQKHTQQNTTNIHTQHTQHTQQKQKHTNQKSSEGA